ncbi:MAG: hypothetical protein QOI74_4096 [Micromonosporaceae bacterium]|jgi:hypothetical protein|nr:hypothetical protein [Micromonosporaceae bacterium]
MVSVDHIEPPDVVDHLLWRDAQQIMERHAGAASNGDCDWCGKEWPCGPRRLAERAAAASRRPWNEAWTARHDLYSLRAVPSWRVELGGRPAGGWHRAGNNRRAY